MRIRAKRGGLLVGLAVLIPLNDANAASEQQKLSFVLEVSKTTYAPFEPVVVQYAVVNSGSREVEVPALIEPDWGWVKVEIGGNDGAFVKYRTGVHGSGEFALTTLQGGEKLAAEIHLLTNAYAYTAQNSLLAQLQGVELFPFAEPGSYRIRATYPLERNGERRDRRMLVSNVVEFTVRGFREDEREAFGYFAGREEFAAAVGADAEVSDLNAAVGRWEEFVRRYPELVYAPAVRLNLGELYLEGNGVSSPDPGRATEHFEAVAKLSDKGVGDDGLVQLAKCQIELGRFDEAATTLSSFFERFPDSARATDAARLREGLKKGLRSVSEIYAN